MEEGASLMEISRLQMAEIARLLAGDLSSLASLRLANRDWRETVSEVVISLRPTQSLDSSQLAQLCSSFMNLSALDLSGCLSLEEGVLASISSLTQLTSLKLHDCAALSEASSESGSLGPLRRLVELDCKSCSSLSDRALQVFPKLSRQEPGFLSLA